MRCAGGRVVYVQAGEAGTVKEAKGGGHTQVRRLAGGREVLWLRGWRRRRRIEAMAGALALSNGKTGVRRGGEVHGVVASWNHIL